MDQTLFSAVAIVGLPIGRCTKCPGLHVSDLFPVPHCIRYQFAGFVDKIMKSLADIASRMYGDGSVTVF